MKRKHLESFLQQLDTFSKPRVELEQYATSALLGAEILEKINEDCGLEETNLLGDLGTSNIFLNSKYYRLWLWSSNARSCSNGS